jgi:DDE superfamily endonuclease
MLPGPTVPASLTELLGAFRGCFTTPSFATFAAMVVGLVAQPGRRTVCGMLAGAGLAREWSHHRAHRFFSHAKWSLDEVGVRLAQLIAARLVGEGERVRVVVDDTLFHRVGKTVFAAAWQHDGSAKGRNKIGRGNCFVVAAILVDLPFCSRPVALPVLFRLWRPAAKDCKDTKAGKAGKGGNAKAGGNAKGRGKTKNSKAGGNTKGGKANKSSASSKAGKRGTGGAGQDCPAKTALARELVDLLVAALPDRRLSVTADAAYRGKPLHQMPANVRFVSRLPANADLTGPTPPPTGKRGRPRLRGHPLGKPADLAAALGWRATTVARYGEKVTVEVASVVGQWHGSWHTTPLRIVLVRRPGRKGFDIALYCTDPDAADEEVIADYAGRWPIETAFGNGKQHTGAGQAHNRVQAAVERTTPFALLVQSVVIVWYALHGDPSADVDRRLSQAPWYRTKTDPSYQDMAATLRRVIIAARFKRPCADQPTPEEIAEIQLAWADAAA